MPVPNLRHTPTREPEARSRLSWACRVQDLVQLQPLPTFDRDHLERELPQVFALADRAESAKQVPAVLNALGLHFVVVPHLPKTYLDGAAFEAGSNPVVAITLRFDRLDNFWFTLAHEIAHVALDHEGIVDEPTDRATRGSSPVEKAADDLAGSWLVDTEAFAAFRQETADQPTKPQIEAFAARVERHPSIVVGKLQHADAITYAQHRWAHVPVRRHLDPWVDRLPSTA